MTHFTRALQHNPANVTYRIALERAVQRAAQEHISRARELESKDQLEAALLEYRKGAELDASNRLAAAKTVELERTIRERTARARPRSPLAVLRERAQTQLAPVLQPANRQPISLEFENASLRDVLMTLAGMSGIKVRFDPLLFQDRAASAKLDGLTIQEALHQVLSASGYFYKVVNPTTIVVAQDTPQARAKYDELVVRVFYLSYADAQELSQLVATVTRFATAQAVVVPNKTANTITVRGTIGIVDAIERVVRASDKPRGELVLDVQILEVDRRRARELGIDLSRYALGLTLSPESAPPNTGSPPLPPASPPPFNLNTISQGLSANDFYLTVPTAVVRLLESEARTRQLANPRLRGAEGQEITLTVGQEIPVVSAVFGAAVAGVVGSAQTAFAYRPVGVNIAMTPRISYGGDILLDLTLESSTLGASVNISGQDVPSFGSRKVNTKLRLREGESNLITGLVSADERRSLTGFPGTLRVPALRWLFGASSEDIAQTDVIMTLTPHLVGTHELNAADLMPIYIGTQQNIGLTGPPPIIATGGDDELASRAPTATPTGGSASPGGALPGTIQSGAAVAAEPTPERDLVSNPTTMPLGSSTAQILVSAPPEIRLSRGPHVVSVLVNNASRLSSVSVTVAFNPKVLRLRDVREGSFMRQGAFNTTFRPRIDAAGRADLTITRAGDRVGASGAGMIAALVFDAVVEGNSVIQINANATDPEGAPVPLQSSPVTVTAR